MTKTHWEGNQVWIGVRFLASEPSSHLLDVLLKKTDFLTGWDTIFILILNFRGRELWYRRLNVYVYIFIYTQYTMRIHC